MNLSAIHTPVALLDVRRMQANIKRMQERMDKLGVIFRPHVKTSKCFRVVEEQIKAGAKGITVSTLKEAALFFQKGATDITYAVGMAQSKLPVAHDLIKQGCDLKIITDNRESAKVIAEYGKRNGVSFKVLIEITIDGSRCGVDPESPELAAIADILVGGGAYLLGVLTHAGSSYDLRDTVALQALAEQERSRCLHAAQLLRHAGHTCPVVSVGSTPTALSAVTLDGVTEVRAGVYVFFDLVMHSVGVCFMDQIALSVLSAVIGHRKEKGQAIVDAGWMAMSRDRGAEGRQPDYGYGQVCDFQGNPIPGYIVSGASQEHGIISRVGAVDTAIAERFPVGRLIRILPNHACATAAQFPEYYALSQDGVGEIWSRFYGW